MTEAARFEIRDLVGRDFAALGPDLRPPLVVTGPWDCTISVGALTHTLRSYPGVTIAVDVGAGPSGRASVPADVLDAFDLAAEGDRLHQARQLADWLRALSAAPQTGHVLAQLSREHDHSLAVESFAYAMLQSGPEFATWLKTRTRRPSSVGQRVRSDCLDLGGGLGATVITLRRHDKHNAYDAYMREQLCDALDSVDTALLLRASGASFCSGGDLDEFGTASSVVAAHLVRTGRSPASRLRHLAPGTVVAVHGVCFGAGIELAAFAKRVIAADDLRVRLPEMSMGLLPGCGGTVSIPARIGRHRFLDLAVSGREIDAATAAAWGLVDRVVSRSELDSVATAELQQIIRSSTELSGLR